MAEVLIGERFDGENRTRSVILESMVVERSYVYTPGSLFFNVSCCIVEEWREYRSYPPHSAHRTGNNTANNQEV